MASLSTATALSPAAGATFVCARPSGVRPSEFSSILHTTTTPMQGMLLTTSNPQQCWQKS
jgi:hypothetical protein